MAKGKSDVQEITIEGIKTESTPAYLVGMTPLIYNAMSEKARQVLLVGGTKKNAAEKAASLKHDPLEEYRNSVYRTRAEEATRLNFPTGAIKKAIASAALDLPGANKSQIGRLVWIQGDRVPVYGVPQIFCSIVRSAGMDKTPDVRTRAILPRWCMALDSITYVRPNLTAKTVLSLLAAAGLLNGIGDWRQQKGSGSYGQFRVAAPDDPEIKFLMSSAGRDAQDAALDDPAPYDEETERLLAWFRDEVARRGRETTAPPRNGARRAAKEVTA